MILDNIVFIHPPRSGGTSIEKSFKWENEQCKHLSAKSIRTIIGEYKWEQSFKFSIIRNPFDRCVSMYCAPWYENIKRGIKFETFESFLSDIPTIDSEEGIQCSDFINEEIDFIIKFENRQSDLDKLNYEFGIQIDKSIHIRKTPREKDYRLYHSRNTIDLVKIHFNKDIEKFGYKF